MSLGDIITLGKTATFGNSHYWENGGSLGNSDSWENVALGEMSKIVTLGIIVLGNSDSWKNSDSWENIEPGKILNLGKRWLLGK